MQYYPALQEVNLETSIISISREEKKGSKPTIQVVCIACMTL